MDTQTSSRRLDLDWLRIAAFGLLIAYHVGMYYVTWGWHIKSPFASDAIEPLMLIVNPWRLSLLFLISGCATAFFLRDVPGSNLLRTAGKRSAFLMVPLIFGMLIVVPPQSYYEVVDKYGYAGGLLDFWLRYLAGDKSFCTDGQCLRLPTWNHLWFVVYLWIFTLVAIAVRPLLRDRGGVPSGWKLLVLPWLLLTAARVVLFPRFGSTHALVGDWYNLAQYFLVFAIGYFMAHDRAAWDWCRAQRWPLLAIAVAGYAAVIVYFSAYSDAKVPPEALKQTMRAVYALLQWSAILAVLGWGRRLLGDLKDTPARAYLSNAVFCYYIVHQTAIVVIAHALRPLALQPVVEGPLLILATVAVCGVSYELARRSALLRPLFGIRAGRVSRRMDGVSRRPAAVSS